MALHTAPPIVLTIAGSDSGGGAGIQADLKTFRARGVHGASAVTAITSQNTREVTAVHHVPLKHVRSQIKAVFDDFPVAAVKTGMLGSASIVRLVVELMQHYQPAWLVVDPVMIASSGAMLLDDNALTLLRDQLIPLADVVTPNLPEAEALLGHPLHGAAERRATGPALLALGARSALLKGGHGSGHRVIDRYFDAAGVLELPHARLPREGHGTGCTLAAAIAAELARGRQPRLAVRNAVDYVHNALVTGYRIGGGGTYVLKH